MKIETELVHFDAAPGDPYRPSSTPIYQTATFRLPSASESGPYDYTRSGNPTRTVLESQLARLERGARALAFNSGMAAITAFTSLLESGETLLAGYDLYGGTWRLLQRVLPRQGIRVRFVDTSRPGTLARALAARPAWLLLETPSNPLHEIADLAAVAQLAACHGCRLAVDNSLMSPYLQRPLEWGADLVIHSGTKFLGGHGDVTAGVVVARDEETAGRIAFYQNAAGTGLSPFDSWLLLRGLKTLSVRVDRQQASARQIAEFIAAHSRVKQVRYVGLAAHPGREIHDRQARGPGSVFSFETGSVDFSRRMIAGCRLFSVSVSFGSVNSSISMPCGMSHASIPETVRKRRRLPEDLVRISIGIEDVGDLKADLSAAFMAATRRKR